MTGTCRAEHSLRRGPDLLGTLALATPRRNLVAGLELRRAHRRIDRDSGVRGTGVSQNCQRRMAELPGAGGRSTLPREQEKLAGSATRFEIDVCLGSRGEGIRAPHAHGQASVGDPTE